MTRKHFEALATALRASRRRNPDGSTDSRPGVFEQWNVTVNAVADVLSESNPRFDRERFFRACEVES